MLTKMRIIYYIFIAFIALIALLLAVSVLPITGNYKIMIVQSGSMTPAIKMGSIVAIKPAPLDSRHLTGQASDYKIGDVITFGPYSKTKAPTTHRIYDIKIADSQPVYITKGDANNAPDQREISQKDVLGKVFVSVPYLGFAVNTAKKPIGFMLIIVVPAVIIIFDEIKKIFNEVRKIRRKKSDI